MTGIKTALFPVGIVTLMALSWINVLDGTGADDEIFNEKLRVAQISEEKEAFITAAECYAEAAEIKPDEEVLLLAAENFLRCGEGTAFLKYCRMAAECASGDRAWLMMADYYLESGHAAKAESVLSQVPDSLKSDETAELLSKVRSSFHLSYKSFSDARPFRDGYFAAGDGKHWGLADEDGRWCILPCFDEAGAYNRDEDIVPVCSEGIWSFVNEAGQTKFTLPEKYTFLGAYGSGLAPFCCDGRYGYTDLEYCERDERYDFAGAFSEGVAAVSENGKWALVTPELRQITDFEYDLIETDAYGFCVRGGVIRAHRGADVILLGTDGKVCGDRTDFPCGLEPVSCGVYSGYRDGSGDTVIGAYFDEVTEFNSNGRALVKEDGVWKVMTLDIYA